jgi:hypothetical protein
MTTTRSKSQKDKSMTTVAASTRLGGEENVDVFSVSVLTSSEEPILREEPNAKPGIQLTTDSCDV